MFARTITPNSNLFVTVHEGEMVVVSNTYAYNFSPFAVALICKVLTGLYILCARVHLFYLAFIFACMQMLWPNYIYAQPSQIGTSTSLQATANSSSRKSFYDTLNNTHWAFWYDGSSISYAKSSDGASWSSVGTLPYNTSHFTVSFKEISGTSYVALAVVANDYDIVVRRGVLSNSAIAFDSEVVAFNGTTSSDAYYNPSVTIDNIDKVWIGAVHDNGDISAFERYQIYAMRSSLTASIPLTTWGTVYDIGRRTNTLSTIILVPQIDDDVYLLQNSDNGHVVGYTFNGSTWSNANTGGDYSWFSFGSNGANGQITSLTSIGTDLYACGSFTKVGDITPVGIAKWDGSTWQTLGAGVNSSVTSCIAVDNNIYAGGAFTLAGGNTANRIAKWDGSTWSALGSGTNGSVRALASINNNIYAGGDFTTAISSPR